MAKFVVTGSAGYIGSVLCRKLEEQGHHVLGVDNRDVRNGLERFINCDYTDEHVIGYHAKTSDVIFHLAASSLLGPSVYDPLSYYVNNTAKTTTLLNTLLKNNFKGRFIFASSAAVYGDSMTPQGVDPDRILHPINPYGRSKLQTEQQLDDLGRCLDFDYLSARFFNVVGAYNGLGQQLDYPHILTSLCRAAYNDAPFHINGNDFNTKDGTCVRDYIHVEDVVDLLISAASIEKQELDWNTFNVCTGRGTSNLDLVKKFVEYTGESVDVSYLDRREGDPEYLVGNNVETRKQFSFVPKHNMEDIIYSAWEHYKKAMNNDFKN